MEEGGVEVAGEEGIGGSTDGINGMENQHWIRLTAM